jgi:hypothetical protein
VKIDMFVTLKVFKLIGPSNDGLRHSRGTYLFISECACVILALEIQQPRINN